MTQRPRNLRSRAAECLSDNDTTLTQGETFPPIEDLLAPPDSP